jgi:hypothetical protein
MKDPGKNEVKNRELFLFTEGTAKRSYLGKFPSPKWRRYPRSAIGE